MDTPACVANLSELGSPLSIIPRRNNPRKVLRQNREIQEAMMATTNDLNTLRIDHIGSLVRPAKLRDVFARYDRGQVSREEFAKSQDEAIGDVIRKQEAHGFPVVTDGESRRHTLQENTQDNV